MSEKEQFEMEEEPLVPAFRKELRAAMERILREELHAALKVEPYGRSDERMGYRHGSEERSLLTSLGSTVVGVCVVQSRSAGLALQSSAARFTSSATLLPSYPSTPTRN